MDIVIDSSGSSGVPPPAYADVNWIHVGAGTISIIAVSFLMWIIHARPELAASRGQLINSLTLVDLCFTLKYTVSSYFWVAGASHTGSFNLLDDHCAIASAWEQFFALAVIILNGCWFLDIALTVRNPMANTNKLLKGYQLLAVGCAAMSAVVVVVTNSFADDDTVCWLRLSDVSVYLVDIPLYTVLAVGAIAVLYIIFGLCNGSEATIDARRGLMQRTLVYYLAFAVMWVWVPIHRALDPHYHSTPLLIVDAIMVSGQAMVLAVLRLKEPGAMAIAVEHVSQGKLVGNTMWALLIAIALRIRSLTSHCCHREEDYPMLTMRRPLLQAEQSMPSLGRYDAHGSTPAAAAGALGGGFGAGAARENLTLEVPHAHMSSMDTPASFMTTPMSVVVHTAAMGAEGMPRMEHDVQDALRQPGVGWDITARLRMEMAMAALSGLCQSLIHDEASPARAASMKLTASASNLAALHSSETSMRSRSTSSAQAGSLMDDHADSAWAVGMADAEYDAGIRAATGLAIGGGDEALYTHSTAGTPARSPSRGDRVAEYARVLQDAMAPASAAAPPISAMDVPSLSLADLLASDLVTVRRCQLVTRFAYTDGPAPVDGRYGTQIPVGTVHARSDMQHWWGELEQATFDQRTELMYQEEYRSIAGDAKEMAQQLDDIMSRRSPRRSPTGDITPAFSVSSRNKRRLNRAPSIQRGQGGALVIPSLAHLSGWLPAEDRTMATADTPTPTPMPSAGTPLPRSGYASRSDQMDAKMARRQASTDYVTQQAGSLRNIFDELQAAEDVAEPLPSSTPEADARSASTFTVTALLPDAFRLARVRAGLELEDVVCMLEPHALRLASMKAHFSDGASSSFFCRALDSSLIVKTISEQEAAQLLHLLPGYLQHLGKYPHSLLTRYYGVWVLQRGGTARMYFTLMSNVMPLSDGPAGTLTFDLKGSSAGRKARPTASVSTVTSSGKVKAGGMLLQDEAFRAQFPHGLSPLRDASALREQLQRDTLLLQQHGLMDYSVLLQLIPVQPHIDYSAGEGEIFHSAVEPSTVHATNELERASAARILRQQVQERGIRDVLLPLSLGLTAQLSDAAAARAMNLASHALVSQTKLGAGMTSLPPWSQWGLLKLQSTRPNAVQDRWIAQLGVIDFLQKYNFTKRAERAFKKMRFGNADISSLEPGAYRRRFLDMVGSILGADFSAEPISPMSDDLSS